MLQQYKRQGLKAALAAIILLSGIVSDAQVLYPDAPANSNIILASEQYAQGHYAMAAQSARQYLDNAQPSLAYGANSLNTDKAEFLLAGSALKTSMPGGLDSAISEMNTTPNPVYRQRLGFSLAQYYFQHNELAKAIPYYEEAGTANLNSKEATDEKFELAYCYFNSRQFNKAEPLLAAIKDIDGGKYYMAGNYYYGLIEYNKDKYVEAFESFNRIKDAPEYKAVVPYYIAEIYYFSGNKEKALHLAYQLIMSPDRSYYEKELYLLEAQCLFEEQRYKDALPYFEFYFSHAAKIRKQDIYEMAFCDYKADKWDAAIDKFKLLSNASDSLGQTAMYLLGDCYLKTGDKAGARNAFGLCADMTFNAGQQEAAMILYARISYETGYDDDALRQLNTLIKTFPNTQYKDEANTLISDLLVKTNNYADALKHLEEVSRKEHNYRQVYQKANYGYAVQEFRKGDLNSALEHFNSSLEHPVDADYESAAYFWKGEIAYRLRHYNQTISNSQDFISSRGDKRAIEQFSPLATVQHAYLNMGYAAMAMQNYADAQDYFSRAQEEKGDNYSGMVAAVRQADAVFMQKNYGRAVTLYDRIIANDPDDADYARYQKAILLGLQGRSSEKIALLQAIINDVPPSVYADHARYEAAVTYMESDKYQQALDYLHQLTDVVTDKSFAPQSWMKTGFIYQQMNKYPEAIEAYKHVVIDYPASADRLAALEALKSLYIQGNQPSAYTRLLKDNDLPSADSSSLDSTYYSAAETQFSNGKWDDAVDAFNNYLREYPDGIFTIKARYYRAESNYQLKNYKAAMDDYAVILAGPQNEFFENSALRAATIAFEDKDYNKAYNYYQQLRTSASTDQTRQVAYDGLMETGFNVSKYPETVMYADSLLAINGLSAETSDDALFYKAKSLQQLDSADAAMAIYKQLSNNKNGERAAESRYHIAEIIFKKGNLKDAEAAANETIHLSAGYDYWIVKSYLLLADVLEKENDYFNADATLESIVKHTKIEDLEQQAVSKLAELKKLEKNHSKLSEDSN